ncbi:MAG: methyltransferase domain-containing protein [Coriobacteriia bacterium]|nr:methyltransferase domain-containing protein [Coriobacteriia bacterium]
MADFGELWRQEARTRRAPDGAAAWDERARDFVSKYGPSGYSEEFLRLAGLQPGETVFDMGCGAGALAIPCAERGHAVLAADFSPKMLERCRDGVPGDAPGAVQTKLLAWDDDWEAAGLRPKSFDVAFASRSIATPDMEAAIKKLSRIARRKVCVTLVAGKSPRVSQSFFDDMGLRCVGHQDAAFAFGIATQLGYQPSVEFIRSTRADSFESRDQAYRAYQDMIRFADDAPQGEELAACQQRAREWVDAHLQEDPMELAGVQEVGRGLPYTIDVPRTFAWAFISWNA